ncbi:hypothetical protein KSP39_PZI023111 [Platanthera zijinensis]|uniref:Uncharacterized protein n=1 Tax=Platanthera zijinensis TaxID=2320716 RepID=A0AAP0AVG6_9ASPA
MAPPPPPAPAKMVVRQCSFIENGPGLSEKDAQFTNGITFTFLFGRVFARNLPMGRAMICTHTEPMYIWFDLYPKKVFAKESSTHDVSPSTHARHVSTGRFGLSNGSTVSLTSSIGWSLASTVNKYRPINVW